jgi:uncharacterized membrane protein YeaQ/YmgE (transglycosylase-associated protein family)
VGWIVTLLVGALIGWLASLIMKTNEQQGCIANILVGIVGAALGRLVFVNLLGIGGAAAAGALSLGGILWGVVGAIILIAILRALGIFK